MGYDVRLIDAAPTRLLVVRRRASPAELSRIVPAACGAVWNVVRASGIRSAGRHVAVYLSAAIDLEVGVEVGDDGAAGAHGEAYLSATPAGTAATVTHVGPYGGLASAHAAVTSWCREHGHGLSGPSWEVYGHGTDDPAKRVTDVFYLVQPR